MTLLDPAAADNVHYATDPRIRHLAEAMWRTRTGGSRMDWLMLGKDNPEALIREAREWVRAAVAGGILPPPSSDPEWKNAAWAAANADCDGRPEIVHAISPDGSGRTLCCGRRSFELPVGDRISSKMTVTCAGAEGEVR